jgi:hypothetical protein
MKRIYLSEITKNFYPKLEKRVVRLETEIRQTIINGHFNVNVRKGSYVRILHYDKIINLFIIEKPILNDVSFTLFHVRADNLTIKYDDKRKPNAFYLKDIVDESSKL